MSADRLNKSLVLLPSAEYTADQQSEWFVNDQYRALEVAINVSDVGEVNEIQEIAVDAGGGTWKATFSAQETAALDFDITAEDLQTALEGLSTIGAGNVSVSGGPGDAGATSPYVVEFIGDLAAANQPEMTTDPALLTGGAGTADVTTTQAGGAGTPSVVFTIQGKDPLSGTVYTVLASAAVTAVGLTRLVVALGVTVAANATLSNVPPYYFRVDCNHADSDPITYSVGATLLR